MPPRSGAGVRRDGGSSLIAGYPWFTDWGRDTFIALRGLCLATGRLGEAEDILLAWARHVDDGMLPNRFPDRGGTPEYNAVDASLWYVVAVNEWLARCARRNRKVSARVRGVLEDAVRLILDGYARGTRHGIRVDDDGLLRAGEAGVQLTWMDAKIGERVVTPRTGKPVEVQALWINALELSAPFVDGAAAKAATARSAFAARFVRTDSPFLHDVVDVDHVPGTADSAIRPNQLFAVGGLPRPILDGRRARRLVDAAFDRLWTPAGPRSLAKGESGYRSHYEGDAVERDLAYHQGTVWPWLAGTFVEAWVRTRDADPKAKAEARRRFLSPLLAHFGTSFGGHLPELADAEPPHRARGCPFQAWSLGETLRLDLEVLAEASPE